MSKDYLAKYYQSSDNMVVNNTKINQKKNTKLVECRQEYKMRKNALFNYKKLLFLESNEE